MFFICSNGGCRSACFDVTITHLISKTALILKGYRFPYVQFRRSSELLLGGCLRPSLTNISRVSLLLGANTVCAARCVTNVSNSIELYANRKNVANTPGSNVWLHALLTPLKPRADVFSSPGADGRLARDSLCGD